MATHPQASPNTTPAPSKTGFEALFALQHIQASVVRQIDDALARTHSTNLTGYELLTRLANLHPEGASVRYLSDQVLLSPSRVSRVAEEFVSRGILERAASPHDGRLALVRLTNAGRDQLAHMDTTFGDALEIHFLGRLSKTQVKALIEIGRSLGAQHC